MDVLADTDSDHDFPLVRSVLKTKTEPIIQPEPDNSLLPTSLLEDLGCHTAMPAVLIITYTCGDKFSHNS
ncbi:putative uncharacterized protein [Desulfovibrio ferrophilus]|uniref:Uncharacterized protein n=1 Tax=Desulfovibrio ferrophilus TaxID=241368 RepID=A0A2Z6AV52_9BACT|nr:putative uncharacterized protein [Desulfovibrio ferrophilus]